MLGCANPALSTYRRLSQDKRPLTLEEQGCTRIWRHEQTASRLVTIVGFEQDLGIAI